MKNIVVAPVGDNLDALFVGLKEFPAERVVLVSMRNKLNEAEKIAKDLKRFKIDVQIKNIEGNMIEEMFRVFAEIKSQLKEDENIIVNVATGDRLSTCAALSASFVNGFKALGVDDNKIMLLPILKFSYYKILTDRKMKILKLLQREGEISLDDLSKKVKMSLPLVSYHINGTLKSEGLKDLGLIETGDKRRRIFIKLTVLGKLLIKGYVNS
ncbi:winged helix-turn-helix transcriptional regulator [Candidatus Woesearchaeota archaeon]|nr:winged helix-turn-helix transcriptional regulator [Candidatus Woesearchaeota archaeon]